MTKQERINVLSRVADDLSACEADLDAAGYADLAACVNELYAQVAERIALLRGDP